MKYIRFLIFFLCSFSIVSGEELSWHMKENDISFSMTLSSSTIALNDSVIVKATLTYPREEKFAPSQLIQPLISHVNPLQPSWALMRQHVTEEAGILKLEAELVPLEEGKLPLSFFDIKVGKTIIWTPIFNIEVTPATLTMAELKEAPLLPLEPRYAVTLNEANRQNLSRNDEATLIQQKLAMHSFPWLFLSLVIIGSLGWLIWKYVRPLYFATEEPLKITLIDPSTEALELLNKIRNQNLPAEQFFNAVTNVVRRYIQRKFHIPVTFQTTDEFISYLDQQKDFPTPLGHALSQFFNEVDGVKFANHTPDKEETDRLYQEVVNIVSQKTTQIKEDLPGHM